MQIIKNILLIKVVLIILLHALIPHKHHIEMTYEEHIIVHERAGNLIDFLGLGFHQDSTKNLDNYTFATRNFQKQIDLNHFYFLICIYSLKGKSIPSGIQPIFIFQSQHFFSDFITFSNGLRAPPDSCFFA